MNKRTFTLVQFIIFILIFSTPVFAENYYTAKKEKIKIGVIIPLTGSLAPRGDDIVKLIPLLQPKLNKSQEYQYEFIIEDGKCGAGNAATTAAMKLINIDNVKYIMTACSGETLQVGPIAEKHKIINLAVLALHPEIKDMGDYIFRTFIDLEKSIEGFSKYLLTKPNNKIAILTEENAFTFVIRDLLNKYLGNNVIFSEDYPADSVDFNILLAKIKAKGAGGIYLNAMSESSLANLVNQTKRLGLKQELYSYVMPEIESFRKLTGENSNGMEFMGTPSVKYDSDDFRSVLNNFMKKYPDGPSYELVVRCAYDAIYSIHDAIEEVGNDTEKVKDFLYAYSKLGALGTVSYDRNGDIKGLHFVLRKVLPNGRIETIAPLVKED